MKDGWTSVISDVYDFKLLLDQHNLMIWRLVKLGRFPVSTRWKYRAAWYDQDPEKAQILESRGGKSWQRRGASVNIQKRLGSGSGACRTQARSQSRNIIMIYDS